MILVMTQSDLVKWIKKELKKGHTSNEIYHFLLHHKHHPDHVHAALHKAHQKPVYHKSHIPLLLSILVVGMLLGSLITYQMMKEPVVIKKTVVNPQITEENQESLPVLKKTIENVSDDFQCNNECATCSSGTERRLRDISTNETRCVQCAMTKHCVEGMSCTNFTCV